MEGNTVAIEEKIETYRFWGWDAAADALEARLEETPQSSLPDAAQAKVDAYRLWGWDAAADAVATRFD